MPPELTPQEITQLGHAYWGSCALHAAVQLDVFTALDVKGGTTAVAGLAEALGCDARALDMLLTALTALGLLHRDGDRLVLPESSRKALSSRSDAYMGHIIQHMTHIAPHWLQLADAVRAGHRMPGPDGGHPDGHCEAPGPTPRPDHTEEERKAFLMGMFNIASLQAQTVARALDLSGRERLLDMGGGPGTYSVYFCLQNPTLRATVFDEPTTEPYARDVIHHFKLKDRIDFTGGDFLKSALPTGYDVAWLSQVLHGENPADAAKLVKRAAQTLRPGGLLCIQEFIINDDRSGPVHSTLFGLNMLVNTDGGQAYTEAELREMLQAAGVGAVRRVQAELPDGCGILCGVKQ